MNKLLRCLATNEENLALSLSNFFFCSATALNLSKPSGKGKEIAFNKSAPATTNSSL